MILSRKSAAGLITACSLLVAGYWLLVPASAHAASRYWVGGAANNNWAEATGGVTNWGTASNTRDNASVPGSSDTVFFDGVGTGASNSTLSADITIDALDMTGYANTLVHNINVTLTIAGNTFKLASGMTYTLGSPLGAALSFTSTTGTSGSPTALTSAGKTVGNVTINGAGGYFSLQDNMVVNSTGSASFNLTAGTFDANGQNLTLPVFNSSNANTRTITMGSGTWTIANSGSIWTTGTATNLTVNRGNPVNLSYSGSTGTRTVLHGITSGTEANSIDFSVTAGSDTVVFGGTDNTFRNIDFTGFSGTLSNTTRTLYGNLTIASGMTVSAGANATTFAATSGTKTITTNGKTIDFPLNFNGVGGTWQLADALVLGSTRALTVTNGTLDLAGFNLTVADAFTLGAAGTLKLQGGETVSTIDTVTAGSIVIYNGTGSYTTALAAGNAYSNLTFNGSGGVWEPSGAVTVGSNLTLTAGTFDIDGQNLTVTGTFSNNDKLRLQGGETTVSLTNDTDSGTVEYDGTTSYTGLKAGNTYNNLSFNGSGGTWTQNAVLDINGTLTLTAGTLDVSGSNYGITAAGWTDTASGDQFNPRSGTVTFDTTGAVNANEAFNNVTVNGAGITTTLGAVLDINGTFTLTAGTLDVSGSNYGITLAGNWSKGSGAFTQRSGTVTLDGTSQTISGATTFYNLSKTVSAAATLTFPASTTQTVTGTWTAQGASGQLLSLRSSSAGTQWSINPTSVSVQYVDVRDSNNTSGTNITCSTGCENSGNNTGWIFPWAGTVYTNEGSTNAGAGVTVALSINGAAAAVTDATDANGAYQFVPGTDPVAGDVLTFYVDGHATIKAVTVTVTDPLVRSGINLYQDRLIVRNDNSGSTTNANLNTADNNGDTDIAALYSVDGSNVLTVVSGKELFIWGGSTYAPGATLTADDIDINGTLTLGSNAATVLGSWDATGGTFTSSGTVTFTSTTTETITSNGNSFSALTFNGAGGLWNLQDALRVTGAVTLTAGSLDLNGSNFNNTGGSFSNNATFRLQGSETLSGFTNDTDSGTTLFDGTGTYSSLSGLTTFYHLTFNGSGGTWTQAAALDVNGTLTLTAGTLDASSNSYGVTLAGGWTDTGAGTYTERSGTITLDGTQTINSNEAFYSLTVNGTGITVSLGAALDINGNLTLTAGTLDVTTANYALSVAGNWTNNATFTGRSGTVTFDGTNQTIAGSTTFYNLTKTVTTAATWTFTAGTTQTVTNTWTATGASGQNLSLRSSSAGTQWSINPQGTRTLSFVDVKDSNNTNSTVILCSNDCVNSGNNSNWAFPMIVTVYSDEGTTTLGANYTVAVSVNGGSKTTADTNSSSIASFTTVGLSPGDVVTFWLDDETPDGVTVTITNATTLTFSIYQNRLLLQHEQGSTITNANLDTADNVSDSDIDALYTLSGTALTVATGKELLINSSDTFTPGGTVSADDIDINGTFAMGTNNVTLAGSWDATGGTFTASNTVTFTAAAAETITSNGSSFNNITYSLTGSGQLTNADAIRIAGTQTINAAGSGSTGSDTTAPTISSVESVPGETQAAITWTTNESADSKVEYGTSSSLGTEKNDTTQTVRHAITITGLTADTTYNYKVTSKDTSNNSASSSTTTFTTLKTGTTADTTAPAISGITVNDVTSSGAKVAWTTNEDTSSSLDYGESTTYDHGATAGTTSTRVKSHTVSLVGLSAATTYHYRIVAIDAAGNIGTSSDQTLTTATEEETPAAATVFQAEETRTTSTAPKLTSDAPAVTDITGRSVGISWRTDAKSTSVVYYRLRNSSDNPIKVGSATFVTDHTIKLTGLDEGTEYEYSVESKDTAGGVLRSRRYQFTTRLPKPSAAAIDAITDTSALFVYLTDSATKTIIELVNLATGESLTITQDELVLQHRLALDNLDPNTKYQAIILVKGPNGAVAKSLAYVFETREDKIDPIISGIETRSALIEGQRDVVQTIVIWQTDEAATSQVHYNDGVSQTGDFRHSSDESPDLTTQHVVILPDLAPSTVYQYKVRSVDKAGNVVESDPRVLLTPQRRVSAFDLIVKNLEDTFGWTRRLTR